MNVASNKSLQNWKEDRLLFVTHPFLEAKSNCSEKTHRDKDGSGAIDYYEMKDAMKAMGIYMKKEKLRD